MTKNIHRLYTGSFFAVGIAVTLLLALNGYDYYSTPVEERFFNDAHSALKPSGAVGHGLGILGTLMMIIGVSVYMIRKRVRRFFNFGYLKHWLEFHIFLCTVGPILVLYHTAFKFGGIVSISFWSMAAVVISGAAGRFIYVRIPRTIQGRELTVREISIEGEELMSRLRAGVDSQTAARIEAITSIERYSRSHVTPVTMFKDRLNAIKELKSLKKMLNVTELSHKNRKEVINLVNRKLVISRRIGMLVTMQKLFRYWHIVHLPFAVTMFIIMLIHVGVTLAFGYKWIF